MPDNDQKNMTVVQVAERFQVHTTTVQRWIQKGHLPGTRKRGPEKNSPFLIPRTAVTALEEKLNPPPANNGKGTIAQPPVTSDLTATSLTPDLHDENGQSTD